MGMCVPVQPAHSCENINVHTLWLRETKQNPQVLSKVPFLTTNFMSKWNQAFSKYRLTVFALCRLPVILHCKAFLIPTQLNPQQCVAPSHRDQGTLGMLAGKICHIYRIMPWARNVSNHQGLLGQGRGFNCWFYREIWGYSNGYHVHKCHPGKPDYMTLRQKMLWGSAHS